MTRRFTRREGLKNGATAAAGALFCLNESGETLPAHLQLLWLEKLEVHWS